MTRTVKFENWIRPEAAGLYCEAGDFYVDPHLSVERAIITHGHSDHAYSGHGAVLASAETLDIMKIRLGAGAGQRTQALAMAEKITIGDAQISLAPAGHILGSVQVIIEYKGARAVVSGDYKRQVDPTCLSFEPIACDLFITEATFGLPVFTHPAPEGEIAKVLDSLTAFPDRTHQIGVYSLGKCQRLMAHLRQAGYERPIWIHGALRSITDYYLSKGKSLGDIRNVADATNDLAGEIVLSPPSALGDRWSRRLADPVLGLASGWMHVRGRARQRGVELPLVISDHADWPGLLQTISDTGAGEIWVTHGREEALVYAATQRGLKAKALSIVAREEDGE
jgi:putative mRNA 3-end processing factor